MFHRTRETKGREAGSLLETPLAPAPWPYYVSSLLEVRELISRDDERMRLWQGLESFLDGMKVADNFSEIYLTGPFVSSDKRPHEIDAALRTRAPYGPKAFAALQPLFAVGLESLRERYFVRLRFWIEDTPPDLCRPFGRPVPQPALNDLMRHGIVRIHLRT